MNLTSVAIADSDDVATIVSGARTEETNLLLLYDDRVKDIVHDYLRELMLRDDDLSILFRGDKIRNEKEFYEAVRDSVPHAKYMSFGLDPLNDILGVEAISQDPEKDTYWIWENAHVFFQSDHESFRRFYHVMTMVAREIRSGYVDTNGNITPPWPGWSPQRLVFVLTGRSSIMLADASQPRSSLYHLPYSAEAYFPDLSTQTMAYHLK